MERLQRRGGWRSRTTASSYIDVSEKNKRATSDIFSNAIFGKRACYNPNAPFTFKLDDRDDDEHGLSQEKILKKY